MKLFAELPEGKIYHGDAYNLLSILKPNSIDLIITDPPYSREFLFCYDILAELGRLLLKEGGSLLTLGGEYYLPYIINVLQNKLNYHYICGFETGSQSRMVHHRKVHVHMKIILWYTKGEYNGGWLPNFVQAQLGYKFYKLNQQHKWQQDPGFCESYILKLSRIKDVVLDPFCGSGTVGLVCKQLRRKFILCDIEEESCQTSLERIKETVTLPLQKQLIL